MKKITVLLIISVLLVSCGSLNPTVISEYYDLESSDLVKSIVTKTPGVENLTEQKMLKLLDGEFQEVYDFIIDIESKDTFIAGKKQANPTGLNYIIVMDLSEKGTYSLNISDNYISMNNIKESTVIHIIPGKDMVELEILLKKLFE